MHEFNKEAIVEQRESKEAANNVLYWTNKKMKQWLNQIDLQVLWCTHCCVQNMTCVYTFVWLYFVCFHIGIF